MAGDLRCLLGCISFNFSVLPSSVLTSVIPCRICWCIRKIEVFLVLNLTQCIPSLSCLEHGFWAQKSLLNLFSLFTASFWHENGWWVSVVKSIQIRKVSIASCPITLLPFLGKGFTSLEFLSLKKVIVLIYLLKKCFIFRYAVRISVDSIYLCRHTRASINLEKLYSFLCSVIPCCISHLFIFLMKLHL